MNVHLVRPATAHGLCAALALGSRVGVAIPMGSERPPGGKAPQPAGHASLAKTKRAARTRTPEYEQRRAIPDRAPMPSDQPVLDAWVLAQIKGQLGKVLSGALTSLGVRAHAGHIVLSGQLGSQAEIETVEQAIKSVRGVHSVDMDGVNMIQKA